MAENFANSPSIACVGDPLQGGVLSGFKAALLSPGKNVGRTESLHDPKAN